MADGAAVAVGGGSVCPEGCLPGGCLPWAEFLAHACENITFSQLLLRTVKIGAKAMSLLDGFIKNPN